MTLRVGYGLINIYAYYGLNTLLSDKTDQVINEFSFGITLMANEIK